MSVVTMWRLLVHNATVCLYLIVLSVIDTVILCTRSGNDWARQVFNMDVTGWIRVQSEVSCQVFWFACNFLLHLCSGVLVLVCLSSTTPCTANRSIDTAKHTLLVLVLILICSNAHYFWTIGRWWPNPVDKTQYYCTFIPQNGPFSEVFRDFIWPIADITLSFLAPNLIIVFILICRRPSCRSQPLKRLIIRDQPQLREHQVLSTTSAELSRIAVCLSVWGLVSTLPEAAYNIFEFVLEHCQLSDAGERLIMQRILAQTLSSAIRDLFLSAKIIAYILLSPTFRKFVIEKASRVWTCRKQRKQPNTAPVRRLTQGVIIRMV